MPAYFRSTVDNFLKTDDETIIAKLNTAYANDGFLSQYTSASIAWNLTLSGFRRELKKLVERSIDTSLWQLLLEYPLYRLRRRIDAVLLTPGGVIVIELKTGAEKFDAVDKRQVIEYAQDLRDFHAASKNEKLFPILWSLEAATPPIIPSNIIDGSGVHDITLIGKEGLATSILDLVGSSGFTSNNSAEEFGSIWDNAAYKPIPSVVDAAVTLFAGHGVREITLAGAKNLSEAANAVFKAISYSRENSTHSVVFLTGVPGAGKTLAGLNIVHGAVEKEISADGDIVYLSGNTPLVTVLREALSIDQHARNISQQIPSTLRDVRLKTRATIQHISDFLKEYVQGSSEAPSGHVIIFDEAQRAWDAKQGKEKFNREASEPSLIMEIMTRHSNWSATVCLVGLGQEINDGENGIGGWADAIEGVEGGRAERLVIFGPDTIFSGTRNIRTLGKIKSHISLIINNDLNLEVPMRSFRSPQLGEWIDLLISSDFEKANEISKNLSYPLRLTRSFEIAKSWLSDNTKGERRKGLLASSGARRLRADGIGEMLSATDGSAIAHWYLKPPGDIRSSHALEVPANEYTSQGLEIDFGCLCWGGDMVIQNGKWSTRRLGGNSWNKISNPKGALYILNSYRVLLSRAREGMIIWVPSGNIDDHTRDPRELDAIANALICSGCVSIQ